MAAHASITSSSSRTGNMGWPVPSRRKVSAGATVAVAADPSEAWEDDNDDGPDLQLTVKDSLEPIFKQGETLIASLSGRKAQAGDFVAFEGAKGWHVRHLLGINVTEIEVAIFKPATRERISLSAIGPIYRILPPYEMVQRYAQFAE